MNNQGPGLMADWPSKDASNLVRTTLTLTVPVTTIDALRHFETG